MAGLIETYHVRPDWAIQWQGRGKRALGIVCHLHFEWSKRIYIYMLRQACQLVKLKVLCRVDASRYYGRPRFSPCYFCDFLSYTMLYLAGKPKISF